MSGGSLRRKIDVVPSNWHDTIRYQKSGLEYERGVKILINDEAKTSTNLPFLHMRLIEDKDVVTWGGTKKTIRLLKTLKSDSDYSDYISLSSYDIASLVWNFPNNELQVVDSKELTLLANAKACLNWCINNKSSAMNIMTPDKTRKIIDNEAKFAGLTLLGLDLDQLVEEIAEELKADRFLSLNSIDERLKNAYIKPT